MKADVKNTSLSSLPVEIALHLEDLVQRLPPQPGFSHRSYGSLLTSETLRVVC